MKATVKDLRLHSAELLAATDRGESVIITYRGKARAVLAGLDTEGVHGRNARNPAFGLWRDQTGAVEDQLGEWRKGRRFDAG